jgi:hypothetical protein
LFNAANRSLKSGLIAILPLPIEVLERHIPDQRQSFRRWNRGPEGPTKRAVILVKADEPRDPPSPGVPEDPSQNSTALT